MNMDGGCGSSSSGASGSGSGSSGSGSGGTPTFDGGLSDGGMVSLIPDGPGCSTSLCGGCIDDPSCEDGQQDYGNCGCTPTPPPVREAGPNQ
jgi:hypothetical protein